MGNIVGRQFGVVASKDYATALAESVKGGNQAKFYLAQKDGKALDSVTAITDNDRNTLIINGNRIQGVSNNDISKLNAITDVTKLFKYKGSVNAFYDLPTGELRDVSVGDVWNIKNNFTLEGVTYPAYTNVVCVTAAYGSAPVIKWDALGGTMEMGTYATQRKESDSIVSWRTENNIPLSEFKFKVSTNTGLYIDNDAKLSLAMSSGEPTLHISTDPATSLVTYQSVINANCPLNSVTIQVSTGLKIGNDNKIYLCLATGSNLGSASSNYSGARVSGLDISKGGLYVVLSSSATINRKFLVNKGDGISLDYTGLVNCLMSDIPLKIYIGSLIDDALKAQ